jgi:hypothetical protein
MPARTCPKNEYGLVDKHLIPPRDNRVGRPPIRESPNGKCATGPAISIE